MITNELISEIKSKINDNQKQAITGGVLQGVLVDMVNGLTTTGLTFLGILGPGDPAPSNEPTRGYYLSFQATTKETRPYFNGVHLHRYSMLIWTQDERNQWKFKRIKYEDHRGPRMVVVGRALPIHYNIVSKSYTIHLSGDGTRDTYAVCGAQVMRGKKSIQFNDKEYSFLMSELQIKNADDSGRKYSCFSFDQDDNNKKFLTKADLRNFLLRKQTYIPINLKTCSPAYKIINKTVIAWVPNIKSYSSSVCFMRRVVRDYYNNPNIISSNTITKVKNLPIGPDKNHNPCEIRKFKRIKILFRNRPTAMFRRYAGISDNCEPLANSDYFFSSK